MHGPLNVKLQLLAHNPQLHNDDLSVIVKKDSFDFCHSV